MKIDEALARASGKAGRTQDEIRQEIVRILGETTATRLFAVFAGTTVTFPLSRSGPSFTALTKVIGPGASIRLCERFGGEQVYVPRNTAAERSERNDEIIARVAAGDPYELIARTFGTTARSIRRIKAAYAARERAGNGEGCDDMATGTR